MIDFTLDNHFCELSLNAEKLGNDFIMNFPIFAKIATLLTACTNEHFYSILRR